MQTPFENKNEKLPTYYYITSKDIYLDAYGNTYTDEFFEYADHEEVMWKEKQQTFSFKELMETFPEAIAPARRGLKLKLKEYKSFLSNINITQEEYTNKVINPASFKEQPQLIKEANELFDNRRDEWNKKIRTIMFGLSYLDELEGKSQPRKIGGVTDEQITEAKSVPITSLYNGKIPTRGKMVMVNCPFHNDKNASLSIYKDQNSWYCHSCHIGGSVVDWVMKEKGYNFLSAVKFLLR